MELKNILNFARKKTIEVEPEKNTVLTAGEEHVDDESTVRFKKAIKHVQNIRNKNVVEVVGYLKFLKDSHDVDYRDSVKLTLELASDITQTEANLFCGQILVELATTLKVQFDIKEIVAELIENDKFSKVAEIMAHPDFSLKFGYDGKQYDLVDTAIKLGEVSLVEQLVRHDKSYNDLSEVFKSLEQIDNEHAKCLEARSLAEIIATKYKQNVRFNLSYLEDGKIKSNKHNMRRLSEYLSYFNDDSAIELKKTIDNANLTTMFTFNSLNDIKNDIITNMKIVNQTDADRGWTNVDELFVEKIYSKNLKEIFPNKLADDKEAISFISNLYEFSFINNLNKVIEVLDKTCENKHKVKNPIIGVFQNLKTIAENNEMMDLLEAGIRANSKREIDVAAKIIANHELFAIEDIQRIFHYKPLSLLNFNRIDNDGLFNKASDIGNTFMMAVMLDKLPTEKINTIMKQVIENNDHVFFDSIVENSTCSIYFKKHLNELSNHYTNSGESLFLDTLIEKGIFGNSEIKQLPITYLKSKGYKFKEPTQEVSNSYF